MRFLKTVILLALMSPMPLLAADVADLHTQGMTALNEQRFDDATEIYRQVLEVAPDDAQAHYRLATAQLSLNQDDAALAGFQAALDSGFQRGGAAVRLAQIHVRNGRNDAAYELLQAAADGGFAFFTMVDGITDFDVVREEDAFKAAYATMRGNRYPCEVDPNAHAFDFWIGDWDVYVGGNLVGSNEIYPILAHCALSENWTSASGGVGKSYNYYDPGDGSWNQIWISDSGSRIEFQGEARDGGIFYTAETVNPADGSVTLHKFEFTPYENGDVRQYWETSTDGGATYTPIWDSRYVRKEAAAED